MNRLALLALLFALVGASAALADAPPRARELHTTRTSAPITIDGSLSEAAWSTAEPCSAFVQRDPVEGARPSQHTEVRVLYDDDALYIGARLVDTEPGKIVSELSRRDGGTRSDKFLVYLDPYYDRRSGYYFGINAAGTQYDGTLYNDGWSDDSWDGVWHGHTKIDPGGWTAELRIPFSQLRFAKADPQRWGINFLRQMGRGFEDDYFVCRPKKESGFVSLFPTLMGLEHVQPTNALEIVPYATSKGEFLTHDARDPFHDGSRLRASTGGDLRMPIGGKLTLNATVNPDFGQVEVDPAVVNLSDVETFFPEKRPFFVEGSSIFDAGQQGASDYWGFNYPQPTFFYSRRIGHAPQGSVPDDAEFSDVPAGTTILGAAKLSGKLSPSLNFGMMHALTAEEDAHNQRADLSHFNSVVEPTSYYGVARLLKEFPERRNGLGLLTTVAHRNLERPIEDEFNRSSVTSIVDGWHFLGAKQSWVLSGWAGGSVVSGTVARITSLQTNARHYFQRPDSKHLDVDSSATSLQGGGARVWLNKEKGNWFSNSAVGFLSPGFEVNDLGFESRADVFNAHAGAGYKWTEPTKQVKNHNMLAAVFGSSNFDGNLTNAGLWGKGFWWFTNNWTFQTSVAYNPQTTNPRRSRGGPLMLNKPGYELNVFGDTDGSRKRYYNFGYYEYLQPEENSWDYNLTPYFVYKPVSNVRLEVGPGYESARDGAFYVTRISDPTATATYGNRYVFARLDQQTLSANLRVNVSFTPTMSLQFYGQPLISTGRYSNFRELARPKSLEFTGPGPGSWTYDPASREFDADGAGPASPSVNDFNTKSLRGNAVFRWEYRPGSAFYLVWTQLRTDDESTPDLRFGPSSHRLGQAPADNIFLAKLTYYLNR
jgi:Domain of unknown function (DUF5916)/Carbohydrate family 9 binding domain-like